MVVSTVLAIVDSEALRLFLGVHRAVLTLGLAVLHQDVGVEELAQHAAVEVLDVPLGFGFACCGAAGGFEGLAIVEEFVAHVLDKSQRLYVNEVVMKCLQYRHRCSRWER